MLPEIKNIKTLRSSLNMTQKDLAARTGLTQSYITKIESGKSDAPYGTIKNIFDTLEDIETNQKNKVTLLAKNIMASDIKKVRPEDSLKKALNLMALYNISQLPVIADKKIVGSITQKAIPKLISSNKKDILLLKVSDVMEEPFPTISEDSMLKIVSEILKSNQAVILTKKGDITGIITSHDLLKAI